MLTSLAFVQSIVNVFFFFLLEIYRRRKLSYQTSDNSPQQSPETCRVIDVFIQQRNVERTGTCTKNSKCTKISCLLHSEVPEPNVATEFLTFYPCATPIHIHFLLNSTLQPKKPLLNVNLTEDRRLKVKNLGDFDFTVEQQLEGVKIGVSLCMIIL